MTRIVTALHPIDKSLFPPRSALAAMGLAVLLMFCALFSAQAEAGVEDEIMAKVRKDTNRLVEKLRNQRQTYYEDKTKFYNIMHEALVESIDFQRISARIMGRYRREASDEQQKRFVEVFKKSLFNAYGKTLVESDQFNINVLSAELNPRAKDRASVNLEVVSQSGNKYPVTYSMYDSEKKGWLLENVIVNGVNLGLAFRDKFEQLMSQHKGNIDKVIDNWTSTVEEDRIQEKK
ncbi:MlaC/ttg2D family ABC transporter substrate-binding protein [Allohahella sp. A8]|uniref:MlaC/ttg2D family ABC transporter substrate-binding protein n=1 Tax=Allohahella sp. A8 TaxID=3141461 RepID=UPI003A805804